MEGQKFGSFTLWFEGDICKHKQYWACKCDCGSIRFIALSDLKSGKRKHCGCKKTRNYEDLKGRKFGRLTVVDYLYIGNNRKIHWECLCECGNTTDVSAQSLKGGATKSCRCYHRDYLKARTKEKSHNWKGGKHISKSGYRIISDNGRTVAEHILVMENFLGRRLYKKESVHHKNGIRTDNRIENLELWASNHPAGQRVSDLLEWSVKLIQTYKPELLR